MIHFFFPTKRCSYLRVPSLKPIRDLLLVSLALSNFRLMSWLLTRETNV